MIWRRERFLRGLHVYSINAQCHGVYMIPNTERRIHHHENITQTQMD